VPSSPSFISNLHTLKVLSKSIGRPYRNGEPEVSISAAQAIPVLKRVLGEVDVVVDYEIVAGTKKVKVAQPGEIVGLQNGYRNRRTHFDVLPSG
jgi:hypothetical protein